MIEGPIPLTPEIDLTKFHSGSSALDDWLRHHALGAHRSDSTKVFVVYDPAYTAAGFYALSAGSVAPDDAPTRIRKGQGRYPIPVALITRLGIDGSYQGLGIGKSLLKDAILRVLGASGELGIRAILAHAKDEDAKQFYANLGFEPSLVHPMWMFLLLKDARASLR